MSPRKLVILGLVFVFAVLLAGCSEEAQAIDLESPDESGSEIAVAQSAADENTVVIKKEEELVEEVSLPRLEAFLAGGIKEIETLTLNDGTTYQSTEGMVVIKIYPIFKNPTEKTLDFIYLSSGSERFCTWLPEEEPILRTKDGFEYAPISTQALECGPRQMYRIPPGIVLVAMGREYNTVSPWRFFFEVPKGVRLESLSIPYEINQFDQELVAGVAVVDLTKTYTGPIPFGSQTKVVAVGEPIRVGDFASLTVFSSRPLDNNLSISFQIESHHKGYALYVYDFSFSVVTEDGVLIYGSKDQSYSLYKDMKGFRLGPGMRTTVEAVWSGFPECKYWLIGQISLVEDSPSEAMAKADFIVEVP